MKKYIIAFLALITIVSCTKLEELNEDKKNPQEVPAGALFANATVELFNLMTSPNVNQNNFRLWSQQWVQVTYFDESNYQLTERDVNGNTYIILYSRVLRDLSDARAFIEADETILPAAKTHQLAMIEVMEIFTYHILVDIFGDVPYSEAISDEITPIYNDDQEIYNDIISRLDAAITNLNGSSSGFGSYDLVYNSNMEKWRKFANSLKLKLAVRIADVDNGKASAMAQQAADAGVMTSNADNFQLNYLSSTPNTNPLWVDLVQSGRNDFVAANTLVDLMNSLDDPRRDEYFMGPMDSLGNPIGGTPGTGNAYLSYSHAGERLVDPTEPGVLMSYSEVEFLLADAAARGFSVPGSAEDHYHSGIRASILYWDGTNAEADAYIAQPDVNWTTAPGDWREKIGTQKYIAMYNRGFEAWATWLLYDAPEMNIAAGAGERPPFRYSYPVDEFSLNAENVNAAAAKFAGTSPLGEESGPNNRWARVFWNVQ